MRVLIFSDTHLGLSFEEKKFNFLEAVIRKADRVIINGDFWEGFEMRFSQFLESHWRALFPVLKRKKAVYILGNHDKWDWCDKRFSLFSEKQVSQFAIRSNGQSFIVEHGHRYLRFPSDSIRSARMRYLTNALADKLEGALMTTLGSTLLRSVEKKLNEGMKKKFRLECVNGEIFVCGHTHYQEFDLRGRFINTGMVRHGVGQYLILEDGKITLKNERYL